MARQKLNPLTRKAVEDQLIDQTKLNAFVAAIARHPKMARLRWRRRRRGCYELDTPYGTLHVNAYFHGCWTAARDTALLVHAHNNEMAIIIGLQEAKATALLHAALGFGNRAPLNDGLIWCLG
jgi:succinate dehydrogenase flavin-adding protein (antitoxin of CptAB toxin-antitoxin module)